MPITLHVPAETVVKIEQYAKDHGLTRSAAAVRMLSFHPYCAMKELDEAGKARAQAIVLRNLERRKAAKDAQKPMVFK